MRRVIRHSVFETNSSSTHSLSISPNSTPIHFNLPLDAHNRILAEFGEFDWGYEELKSPLQKLSYLLTIVAVKELQYDSSVNPQILLANTPGFKLLDEWARGFCDGISFKNLEMVATQYGEYGRPYIAFDGGLDHQSSSFYSSLQEFLSKTNLTIEEIILDSAIIIIIDSDNTSNKPQFPEGSKIIHLAYVDYPEYS